MFSSNFKLIDMWARPTLWAIVQLPIACHKLPIKNDAWHRKASLKHKRKSSQKSRDCNPQLQKKGQACSHPMNYARLLLDHCIGMFGNSLSMYINVRKTFIFILWLLCFTLGKAETSSCSTVKDDTLPNRSRCQRNFIEKGMEWWK